MNFIENIRVSQKRPKTGFGAENNIPAMIFGVREIAGISIQKYPTTESDEFARAGSGLSYLIHSRGDPPSTTRILLLRWMGRPYDAEGKLLFHFRNKDFKRSNMQFLGAEISA